MSLQVWLPLNGDLNNYGLEQATISGGNSYVDNGKIGKAYNNSSDIVITSNVLKNAKVWSFCFWCYAISAQVTSDWTKLLRLEDGGSSLRVEVCTSSNLDYNYSVWNNSTALITTKSINPGATSVQYLDKWTHCCLTSDGSIITEYLDGVKIKSVVYDCEGSINGIFKLQNSNIAYKNDFRAYDRCLSEKEVKEISKGLILHYKLEGSCGGSDNLLLKTNQGTTNWGFTVGDKYNKPDMEQVSWLGTNALKVTSKELNSDYTTSWKVLYYQDNNFYKIVKPNTKYSISIDSTVNITGDISIRDTNGLNTILWISPLSSTQKIDEDGNIYYHITGSGTSSDFTSYSYQVVYISTGFNYLESAGNIAKYANIKIEEGDKSTPWTPNPADIGNSGLIEYDCSGYGNDGTKNNNPITNSDSPRYSASNYFGNNSGTAYIKSPLSLLANEVSCSFWVKPNESDGKYSIVCCNYNDPSSGFWIATNCEGNGLWFYTGTYIRSSGGLLTNGTWYHAAFTFKDGIGKWYQNGVLMGTTDISSTKTVLPITNLSVGNNYTGTNWNTTNYNSISDFRIYSTTLSAEDVKELYETSGAVDNLGNVYAREVIE